LFTPTSKLGRRWLSTVRAGAWGTLAVQLAVSAGARVIGTGRAEARDLVLHLEAEQYLDLALDALDEVKGVDVVFD